MFLLTIFIELSCHHEHLGEILPERPPKAPAQCLPVLFLHRLRSQSIQQEMMENPQMR